MKRLLVAASTAVVVLAGAPAMAGVVHDHLECFAINDSHNYEATLNLSPEPGNTLMLPDHEGCTIKVRSKEFCIPTSSTVVETDAPQVVFGGPDLTVGYLCYKMKCPIDTVGILPVSDAFGLRDLSLKKITRICTPTGW